MSYFNIKRPIFIVPSEKSNVECKKIDEFMILLEKSDVGKIIEYVKYKDKNCKWRRGLEKVSSEIMLMCLGVNIRRYLSSTNENKFKNNRWNTPENLSKEIFSYVKQKKKKV